MVKLLPRNVYVLCLNKQSWTCLKWDQIFLFFLNSSPHANIWNCEYVWKKVGGGHSCLSNHFKHYIMFINSTKSESVLREEIWNSPEEAAEWLYLGEDTVTHLRNVSGQNTVLSSYLRWIRLCFIVDRRKKYEVECFFFLSTGILYLFYISQFIFSQAGIAFLGNIPCTFTLSFRLFS